MVVDTAEVYDIAIIGAGAAGCLAAIRAGYYLGKKVVLIERNSSIGKKLMLTGGGHCNLTNTASLDTFIKRFKPNGEFLRSAFFLFSNEDLMEFFRSHGLQLKVEKQGRVLPATDKAASVVTILRKCLKEAAVTVVYNTRVTDIERHAEKFILITDKARFNAHKVIIACGGASYKATGSTGDGAALAKRLHHTIVPLTAALVPLRIKDRWVRDVQGVTLKNVTITFFYGDKKVTSDTGEMLFTHFGVSGPLVLDASADVVSALTLRKEIQMTIDFVPQFKREELQEKLARKFSAKSNSHIKHLLQDFLPKAITTAFLSLLDIAPQKPANQLTKIERYAIVNALKQFPLTAIGSLALNDAMVTAGGVSMKEINPRTMESIRVPGLYFAGEVIEGRATSGGYNLQQAFSTGYCAGQRATENLCTAAKLHNF
jgi:predicted Rossmann fold flavoprotein